MTAMYLDGELGGSGSVFRLQVVWHLAVPLIVIPQPESSARFFPLPCRRLLLIIPTFSRVLLCILLLRVPICFSWQFSTYFSQGSKMILEGDVISMFIFLRQRDFDSICVFSFVSHVLRELITVSPCEEHGPSLPQFT